MKLLGSTESKITKDKNRENVPHLEVVELVLVHCNLVNDDYQQDSRILYTFVPNKTFGSLLEISPTNHIFLKTLKGYGFLSFARNIGTHGTKVARNMSNKYGQKLADTAKKFRSRWDKDCFKKSNLKNS